MQKEAHFHTTHINMSYDSYQHYCWINKNNNTNNITNNINTINNMLKLLVRHLEQNQPHKKYIHSRFLQVFVEIPLRKLA